MLLRAGAEVDAVADMYEGKHTTMSMLVSSGHPAKAGLQVALTETLLDFGAPDAAATIRRAAEAGGVPLKLVEDDGAEALEFYKAALLLVRPDQFVAWVSDGDVTDAAGIIRRVAGGQP